MRTVAVVLGAFAYCLLSALLPDVAPGVDGTIGVAVVFVAVLAAALLGDVPFPAVLVGLGAAMTAGVLMASVPTPPPSPRRHLRLHQYCSPVA